MDMINNVQQLNVSANSVLDALVLKMGEVIVKVNELSAGGGNIIPFSSVTFDNVNDDAEFKDKMQELANDLININADILLIGSVTSLQLSNDLQNLFQSFSNELFNAERVATIESMVLV